MTKPVDFEPEYESFMPYGAGSSDGRVTEEEAVAMLITDEMNTAAYSESGEDVSKSCRNVALGTLAKLSPLKLVKIIENLTSYYAMTGPDEEECSELMADIREDIND